MKLVVTGASGFIGTHLTQKLVSEGHTVTALVREGSKIDRLDPKVQRIVVSDRIDSVLDALKTTKPDWVIHLATCYVSKHQRKDVEPLIQSNIHFGIQVLESMKELGIRNLINTSTTFEHFEGADYDPVNLYAATKKAYEVLARYYVQAEDFKVVTLKLTDTYGPNDERSKLLPTLKRRLKEGSSQILSLSKGEQEIDLLHVKDVVEAFSHVLKNIRPDGYQEFRISQNETIRLKDLIHKVSKIVDQDLPVSFDRPYQKREVMKPWRGGVALPGWTPQVSLDDGLKEFFK